MAVPPGPRVKFFFLKSVASPCEKVIFAFEGSYITSAVKKQMLDVLVPKYKPLKLEARRFRTCESMWLKLGEN